MTILPASNHNFKKDFEKVKIFSSKIEKKIHDSSRDSKIDRLTAEQLEDLNEILHLASYLLTKYEDKKDFYEICKEFVDMINSAASSIDQLDGDIEQLVLSAEESISHIKETQVKIAQKVDFDSPSQQQQRLPKTSSP